MKRILAILAAVITAAFLCAVPARAVTRSEQWQTLAEAALARAEALDNGTQRTSTYAFMAQAVWRLDGWTDPRVATLLTKIYSQANPDGGWGIGTAWDALSDGTINPADTSYTVTMAGHVGPLLLAGYKAGVVPREKIQAIVNWLWSTPRIPGTLTAYGQCIAYSRNANDVQTYACVHNVNSGAAAFLSDALTVGVAHSGGAAFIVDMIRRETYAYRPATDDWLYMDTASVSDFDHNSYAAESMRDLAPMIGAEVAYQQMIKSSTEVTAPIAHIRLTGLTPLPGRDPMQWCALGDQWIPEAQAYQLAQINDAGRQAQIAWYAAANAIACQEPS